VHGVFDPIFFHSNYFDQMELDKDIRIGVFVCHCGLNIAATVDIARVVEAARTLPCVTVVEDNRYSCSKVGQSQIARAIKEHNINRIIVAACSPRLHEETFRQLVASCGLNPYIFEMANIRDQCSWVHSEEKEEATDKAIALIRSAVARARHLVPLEQNRAPVVKRALVVGGGVAGISAALYLANAGIETIIVERKPSIGGHMAMLDKTFPTLDCSLCILAPKMVDIANHPKITLRAYSEIVALDGRVGDFHVTIRRKPRFIDPAKCVACGLCATPCPVKVPEEFNRGLTSRKAIYIPFAQSIPPSYLIDPEHCIRLQKGKGCGLCVKQCAPEAINFDDAAQDEEFNVGAIIIATGFEIFDARLKSRFGYGRFPNVLTQLDFERILSADGPSRGELIRPSDGKPIRRIAFVQCVGSRDRNDPQAKEYCSRVCCMITAKQAFMIKERSPETEVYVYYNDMRTAGKGFEEFYNRCRDEGVIFLRGLPGELQEAPSSKNIIIETEDTETARLIENELDAVVLASGLLPAPGLTELAQMMHISRSAEGFLLEAHPKLRPAETPVDGLYLAGAVQFPKDIPDSVAQAGNAVAVAMELLSRDSIEIEPLNAIVDESKCIGCGLCESICPYGAPRVEQKEGKRLAVITAVMCKGCGACASSCPEKAITMSHYTDEAIQAQINALLAPT
jgi:heterodisulfide reductase subunit A